MLLTHLSPEQKDWIFDAENVEMVSEDEIIRISLEEGFHVDDDLFIDYRIFLAMNNEEISEDSWESFLEAHVGYFDSPQDFLYRHYEETCSKEEWKIVESVLYYSDYDWMCRDLNGQSFDFAFYGEGIYVFNVL